MNNVIVKHLDYLEQLLGQDSLSLQEFNLISQFNQLTRRLTRQQIRDRKDLVQATQSDDSEMTEADFFECSDSHLLMSALIYFISNKKHCCLLEEVEQISVRATIFAERSERPVVYGTSAESPVRDAAAAAPSQARVSFDKLLRKFDPQLH